jgi:UDP-2-acetamido-3-amino-2,3-dideoxy-glucuronate N-acetyltransferase
MSGYEVHETAVIDAGAFIGAGTRIWHFCHLMPGSRIGHNCNLGQNVFVDRDVVIGNGVKIQNNVSLYRGVVLHDEVFVGPSAVFTNVINPRSFIDRKAELKATVVEQGATIGANATLVCGVRIGSFAFVGAGSVVTRDVAAFALVQGNPARNCGWVSRSGGKLVFNSLGEAVCLLSGERYQLESGVVSLNEIVK